MKKKRANREEIISEWLSLFPLRRIEDEQDDEGIITLIVPHSENWFTRKFFPTPKKPAGKIHLDKIGTYVWKNCDGKQSVKTICDGLTAKFGEEVKPVEERTVMFLQHLYRQKFIEVFAKK